VAAVCPSWSSRLILRISQNGTPVSAIAGHRFRYATDSGATCFRLPGLRSPGVRLLVFDASQVRGGFSFSNAVAFEIDTMSVVNDAVEDGVGDPGKWLRRANHVVPLLGSWAVIRVDFRR
jgi:hypothetical protein